MNPPVKSIRLKILTALVAGPASIAELQIPTGQQDAKKLKFNVDSCVKEALCKRQAGLDGTPEYKITTQGKEWLKKQPYSSVATTLAVKPTETATSAEKEAAAEATGEALEAAQAEDPTAITPGGQTDIQEAARQESEAVALDVLEEAMPGFTAATVAQKDEQLAGLRHTLAGAEAAGQMLQQVIEDKDSEIALLREQLRGSERQNDVAQEEIMRLGRLTRAALPPRFYVSAVPGDSLAQVKRHAKRESAEARAASLVKSYPEALVLVPIARATRGAVVNPL